MNQLIPIRSLSGSSYASAVLLNGNRLLTAAHTVHDGSLIAQCENGEVTAFLDAIDERVDLAVLHFNSPCDSKSSELADDNPDIGETVWELGSPLGHDFLTHGIVNGYALIEGEPYLVADTQSFFGSSGGPLYNDRGKVVGIMSRISKMVDSEQQVYVYWSNFVPAKTIKKFISDANVTSFKR